MKKTLALLISLAMICSLCLPVFANNTTGSLLNGASDLPPVYDPENERRNTEKEIEMMISPAYDPDAEPAVTVTRQAQITSYYCGPASAAIVLDALNAFVPPSKETLSFSSSCPNSCSRYISHLCSQTHNNAQVTLGKNMQVTPTDAPTSAEVKNAVNQYLPSNYYSASYVSSANNLAQKLTTTLCDGHPVILGVIAYKLPYYNNNQYYEGHYVVVDEYDPTSERVHIVDPNYHPNYGKEYWQDLDDVYNALFVNDHQIIW